MKQKIVLGLGALATTLAVLPLFAAFEAHVINVTARIENALNVPVKYLEFGTVFPQEKLEKPVDIMLSQSFLDEDRVDDVEYFIRQKPKCAITWNNGTEYDNAMGEDGTHIHTRTGHIKFDAVDVPYVDCGLPPRELTTDPNVGHGVETWGVLPDLCPYLSKHSEIVREDENGNPVYEDGVLPSFHEAWSYFGHQITWNDVKGRLAKSAQDIKDTWMIDLAVPCFGGYCAQDWAEFVHGINPDAGDPNHWTQPIANEHKIFGCDLWVEVTGISLPGLGCNEKADIMLVLDRSGSIGDAMPTLKTAAKAFVDALSLDGVHAGLASFATGATLNIHLTNDATALKTAIDGLASSGLTDLEDGILVANGELANPGDGHDRADGESPDFMVIVTDGQPNQCNGSGCDPDDAAAAAADAARAAGIEVYVVGVGSGVDETYLKTEIADDAAHYFSAADFDDLEAILEGIAQCNEG